MRSKIVIVALAFWAIAAVGGGLWGQAEQYYQRWRTPAGLMEVQKLRDLYLARQYDEVATECERAEDNSSYGDYQAQILYIHWVDERQCGRTQEAARIEQAFFKRFPDSALAGDIYFASAMNALGQADYVGAERTLDLIVNRYPSSDVANKATEILAQLRPATTAPATRNLQ